MLTFATRLRKNGNNKFIEKIEGKYKKQVPRKNTIYREALILLKEL